jgi:hypothetical protein
MSSNSALNRRSFLARSAAIAAVPAVATLAGGALAEPASADTLPDYAPIPPSALGPAVNAQGYFVGPVEKNLYWVTDGTYQAAFLTTREGVVLFDAPPSIGNNLQRAIDEIASANGVSNKVTPDNIYIHFPDHDTLMLVDVILPGWVPYDSFNLNEDVPGSIAAPATAMAYPWEHFIGGHMGRLGTRDDMAVYQQYVTDLIDNIKIALVTVDPTPFFTRYGNNSWAAVKTFQDAQVAYATGPVIQKYTGVLAAADVYTASTAFHILESIRLDLGFGSQVHP